MLYKYIIMYIAFNLYKTMRCIKNFVYYFQRNLYFYTILMFDPKTRGNTNMTLHVLENHTHGLVYDYNGGFFFGRRLLFKLRSHELMRNNSYNNGDKNRDRSEFHGRKIISGFANVSPRTFFKHTFSRS